MDIAQIASESAHGSMAVGAIYTPPGGGDSIDVDVVLDFDVERMESDATRGAVLYRTDQADFLRSQVYPKRGGELEIDDESSAHHEKKWPIRDVVEDDQHIVTVALGDEIE